MKKIFLAMIACIILAGCILATGCVSQTPTIAADDAVWTATEYDDGFVDKSVMIFHPNGSGEKPRDKGNGDTSLRAFTWTQPDNRHFLCTFDDGDIDTFTLTDNGKLTHDGKYYTCTQAGSLPAVSTPVASPQDHPEIVGTWEYQELKDSGIKTKTLEFEADGTGIKTITKPKGAVTTSQFTWVPVGSCYLLTYPIEDDDDTVRIVNGRLDHDGEVYTKA